MTYFEVSDGVAVLTFVPHRSGGWTDTATFDVITAERQCVSDHTMPPDWTRKGHSICSNIDRATARELRDALTAWLAEGPSA